MRKTKICKKCLASFVPMKDEDYCSECCGDIYPETKRNQEIIKRRRR